MFEPKVMEADGSDYVCPFHFGMIFRLHVSYSDSKNWWRYKRMKLKRNPPCREAPFWNLFGPWCWRSFILGSLNYIFQENQTWCKCMVTLGDLFGLVIFHDPRFNMNLLPFSGSVVQRQGALCVTRALPTGIVGNGKDDGSQCHTLTFGGFQHKPIGGSSWGRNLPVTLSLITRWWQLKYVLFSPRTLGKWFPFWMSIFFK